MAEPRICHNTGKISINNDNTSNPILAISYALTFAPA